jgi:transforming growth factor-beta-induced protein
MASQEGTNQDQTVDSEIDTRLQTRNIADSLATLEECSTLSKLVREADAEYVLRRSGLRTLLAPNNESLKDFHPENLEEFLERHLLPGGQETFDLRRCREIKTVSGTVLAVRQENSSIRIGNALITRSDIPCTNGVIQVVDSLVAE